MATRRWKNGLFAKLANCLMPYVIDFLFFCFTVVRIHGVTPCHSALGLIIRPALNGRTYKYRIRLTSPSLPLRLHAASFPPVSTRGRFEVPELDPSIAVGSPPRSEDERNWCVQADPADGAVHPPGGGGEGQRDLRLCRRGFDPSPLFSIPFPHIFSKFCY